MFKKAKFVRLLTIISIVNIGCKNDMKSPISNAQAHIESNVQSLPVKSNDNTNYKAQNYIDYWQQELKYITNKKVDKKGNKLKHNYIVALKKAIGANSNHIDQDDKDPIIESIRNARGKFYKHINKASRWRNWCPISKLIARCINLYETVKEPYQKAWINDLNSLDKEAIIHRVRPKYTSIFQSAITADNQKMLYGIYVPKENYTIDIKDRRAVIFIGSRFCDFDAHDEVLDTAISYFDKTSDYIFITRRGELMYKCDKNMQTEDGLCSDTDTIIYELLKRGYQLKNISVVGSYVGGFQASYISSKFNIKMALLICAFCSIPDRFKCLIKESRLWIIFKWLSRLIIKATYRSNLFYKYDSESILRNKVSNTPILQLYPSYDKFVSSESCKKIPATRSICLEGDLNLLSSEVLSLLIQKCTQNNFELDRCFRAITAISQLSVDELCKRGYL